MTATDRRLLAALLLAGLAIRLVYASYDLDGRRFWDERYSLMNVQKILDTGSLRPAKGYYPSPLVSWPQAGAVAASALLHTLTGWDRFAIRRGGDYSPTTYLLVRLFSVLYGTAAIGVLFLLGRRIASPAVGLVAATALAFTPWAIRQSGVFKPDALLLLTVLLAALWSLRAVLAPRAREHLLAGLGIALAASAKITGGMVAVALAAGTLAMDWRDRRRWLLLAVGAAASLVFFFALNPFGADYPGYVASLRADYELRAELKGMGRWEVPRRVVAFLAGRWVHGPWFGGAAMVGALAGVGMALRRRDRSRAALATMLLAFPLLYVGAYSAVTPHFKGNNFLPIVPFTALAGAMLLVGVWRRAGRRVPLLAGRAATAAAATLLVAGLATPGLRFVYRSLTPTTVDAATLLLQSALGRGAWRYIAVERWEAPEPAWEPSRYYTGATRARVVELEGGALRRRRLDRADGEILRLDGGAGAAVVEDRRRRFEPAAVTLVESAPFRLRGPAVVAIYHPWRPGRAPRSFQGRHCADRPDCVAIEIPKERGLGASRIVSATVRAPEGAWGAAAEPPAVLYRGRPLRIWSSLARRGQMAFATERFRLGRKGRTLRLEPVEIVRPERVTVEMHSWRRRELRRGDRPREAAAESAQPAGRSPP